MAAVFGGGKTGSGASGDTRISPTLVCALATRLAASVSGVRAAEVMAETRVSVRAATARHVAIYLAHTSFGLPFSQVAKYFGRDRKTVAYACRAVEDRRDDREFDAELAQIEALMRTACGAAQ